ncbi:response regulator [Diaphorobacter sp. NR2-3-3-1]|nr:response regulator [Diaphorobacter caeni]
MTSDDQTTLAGDALILIVEDEPRLASVLGDYLKAAGFRTEWIADGAQVLDAYAQRHHDLVLLDLMLPHRSGVDLCRDLRARSEVPIIMVTARVDEVDRLLGLQVGADDYVCKPFSPREVVARVTAVLRRYRHSPAQMAQVLEIDEANFGARFRGRPLDLTPVEFRLLSSLAAAPLRVWSRGQLMNRLYPDHRVVVDRTIDSHIKNLRRKLLDAGSEDEPIRSVYGVGYRLEVLDNGN